MRDFSSILLIFCLLYGVSEFRKWRTPEMRDMLTQAQKVRRVANYAALLIVISMLLGGTWLPLSHPSRQTVVLELSYWTLCLAIAVVIPVVAVLEYRATMRQSQIAALAADRDEAFKQVVEIAAKSEERVRKRAELPHRNGHD